MSNFFQKFCHRGEKQGDSGENAPQNPDPEPGKPWSQGQKPQDGPQNQSDPVVQPEKPPPGDQQKPHHGIQQDTGKEQIHQPGAGPPDAPWPAQNVVDQPQQQPKGRRNGEFLPLKRNGQLHQPNSRAKNPVGARLSSS